MARHSGFDSASGMLGGVFALRWPFWTHRLNCSGEFLHLYGIWVIVHLWDLIIIDFGHILLINPDSPPIPNTEGRTRVQRLCVSRSRFY